MPTIIKLIRVNESDVRITGSEIGSVRVEASALPASEIWTILTLLERSDGSWIIVRQRDEPSYKTVVGEYHVINRLKVNTSANAGLYGEPTTEAEALEWMVKSVMVWLDFTQLAKQLANSLGWKVVETVD